jgi:DNA-binding LytR/AlgR family response regulator
MKMKCVIVDDEPRAHAVLKHYIEKMPAVELAGTAYSAMEAYDIIKNNKIDIVLLDINMHEMDGFSLMDMLEPRPMVIFITAHTEYAFKSYDYSAIDYLHKPLRFERLVKAIDKATRWKAMQAENNKELEIKADGYNQTVQTDDICYIESMGNYCKLYLKTKKIITLSSLKDLEAKLPRPQFIRIHKSYIVNLCMVSVMNEFNMVIENTELPIGKTYKKYVLENAGKL